MKPIESIDINELRQAIKVLNNSGLHPDGKMKAIGVKQNLIDEFTKRVEDIPDEIELPKEAADFYHDIYADEMEEEDETDESAVEKEEVDSEAGEGEEISESDEAPADALATDDEDDPEKDELLEPEELLETGHYEKKLLLDIIKKNLQPAVDEHILFTTEDIVAYNGEICMKYPFFTDMNCAINVTDLYKTLSKFPSDSFQMSFDKEKNELQITSKNVRAGYISSPRINLIDSLEEVIDDANKINWEKLPEDFIKGVELVHFAASKFTAFGTATCLYVNGKELVTTDRTRISHYMMGSDMGEFFVRADNIKHLNKLTPTGFGLSKNWVHFQNDEYVTISFRLMHGEFPDYADLIDYSISENPIPLTREFQNMVKMNHTMSKAKHLSKLYINVNNGKIKCKSSNERGWVETDTNVDYDGEPFTFSIDPVFLLEALKHGVTSMGLASQNALALEADNFKHLVALMAD